MAEQQERRRAADAEIVRLQLKVEDLEHKIESLEKSVKELVSAWNTAQGLTSFIKWASTVTIGLGTLFAFFSAYLKRFLS